jgi:hypothetical protein
MSLLDSLLGGYVNAQQSGQPQPAPSRRTLVFQGAQVIDNGPTANSTTVLISGGGGAFPGGALCSGTGTTVSVGSGLTLAGGTLSASGGGGGAALIPSIPSTQFLCHFDGSGSSFVNNGFCIAPKLSIASIGSVSQTTANYKFGPASLLCDGNAANGVYVDNSSGTISFGSGAWTWECWVYLNSTATYDSLIAASSTGDYQGPVLILSGGVVYAYASANGGFWDYTISTGYTLPTSQWNHVALVADGAGNLSAYANGSRIGSTSVGNIFCSNKIWMGHYPYFPGGPRTLNGFVDEVRLSNIAQYSGSSYTIPSAPFVDGLGPFPPGATGGTLAYTTGLLFTCLGAGNWQYNVQTNF